MAQACPTCKGNGVVFKEIQGEGGPRIVPQVCQTCGGKGSLPEHTQ